MGLRATSSLADLLPTPAKRWLLVARYSNLQKEKPVVSAKYSLQHTKKASKEAFQERLGIGRLHAWHDYRVDYVNDAIRRLDICHDDRGTINSDAIRALADWIIDFTFKDSRFGYSTTHGAFPLAA